MKRHYSPVCTSVFACFVVAIVAGQGIQPPNELLRRRYVEGQRLEYLMTADNNGSQYEVRIAATTVKKSDGSFVEELAWSGYLANGKPRPLSPSAEAFRLTVTLDGGAPFVMPDWSKLAGLVGPVADVLNFYADQFLAIHQGALRQPGDRFVYPTDIVPSWADGTSVVLGQDHVHFDLTLTSVDSAREQATLLIKHVPPAEPKIKIPADWM